jgi:hypothetical protein
MTLGHQTARHTDTLSQRDLRGRAEMMTTDDGHTMEDGRHVPLASELVVARLAQAE